MSSPSQGKFNLRERNARDKARPQLNREHCDILVGRPYGKKLSNFLRQNGVAIVNILDEFVDIIEIAKESDLDKVDRLIEDWTKGDDFTPQGT